VDLAPVSLIRLRMRNPDRVRDALLKAVCEDNRALVGGRNGPVANVEKSRSRPDRAWRRRIFRRPFGLALLVTALLVVDPAATSVTAHWVETSSAFHPDEHAAREDDVLVSSAHAFAEARTSGHRDGEEGNGKVADPEPPRATDRARSSPSGVVAAALSTLDRTPEFALAAASEHIPMTTLFGLTVGTIVIDAGHGGADSGAVGARGTREKDVTLDLARRLALRLERDGRYRVVLTRSRDERVSLAQRVDLANAADADLFLSIHVNALPNRRVNVVETYYFDFAKDPAALLLAAIENRDSGMPVGYFRTLLERIGDAVKLEESRAFAQHIQASMIKNIRLHDAGIVDSGVKVAPFAVLSGVNVPAALVEVSCISNADEETKLSTPQYRENIASYLEEGIAAYLDHRQLQARGPAYHERQDAFETAERQRQGS
jgi:N-acetylmuramoyl-L-alanine amidase